MRYLRLKFRYVANSEVYFPANPVNTFRGALGFHLAKIACIQRNNDKNSCNKCMVFEKCAYAVCYETGQRHFSSSFSDKNLDMPHLMTIDACFPGLQPIKEGDKFDFSVCLYGRGVEAAPYLIVSARNAGIGGFTHERKQCDLIEVFDSKTGETVWEANQDKVKIPEASSIIINEPEILIDDNCELNMKFVTPVAFKDSNSKSLSLKPEFSRIIGSLMRRYSAFEASEGRKISWNFAELSKIARRVCVSSMKLEPIYWERFSNRQKQRIPISGVIGTVSYTGSVGMFIDILKAGEIIRCGRSTSLGQGKISVGSTIKFTTRDASDVFVER